MKFLFIFFAFCIFWLRIFAEDNSTDTLAIAKEHNRNVSRDLKLKVVQILNSEIVKNSSYAQTQTIFATAKEEALTEFNATKIGNGPDIFDPFYINLKSGLDAYNRAYYRSTTLFNKAIVYYKNYIVILMVVYEPQPAHEETKKRAIAKFEEDASSDNALFEAFKQKLDKELDYQFRWTFPDLDTSGWLFLGGAGGTTGGSNNYNGNATLGHTTNANHSTETTTAKIIEIEEF